MLVVGFALAFGVLLSFSPKLVGLLQVGLTLLFGGGATLLWTYSGNGASDAAMIYAAIVALSGVLLTFASGIQRRGLRSRQGSGELTAMHRTRHARPAMSDQAFLWPAILLIVLGWLISYYSSTHGGANPMIAWVEATFGVSPHTAEMLVVAFRKTVHFSYYGVVAWTAFAVANRNGATHQRRFIAAFLTAIAFASFDEVRQSTQPDRVGSAWDVLLDGTGAAVALACMWWLDRRVTKAANAHEPQSGPLPEQ